MDTELQDKHFFLTGASGGIGLKTAEILLNEEAILSLQYNTNKNSLTQLVDKYPSRTHSVMANMMSEADVIKSIQSARDKLGPIHGLVLNHGFFNVRPAPIHQMSLDQWNETLSINLTGSFLVAREFLKNIIKDEIEDPSIVIIGSTAGIFGEADHGDYASSKSALTYGFMRSLKNEIVKYAPLGRVNTIAPGWVRTPMAEEALKDVKKVTRILQTIPLRKVATSEDIGNSIVLLLSNKLSSHISGEIIEISGGMEGRVLFTPEEINNKNNL
jgi:NAD(P)-dependent dehydrogenase (short-subunit alcohol dehydrogenase family)